MALWALVMAITLSAGLWPFSFRAENQVSWEAEHAGLYFGDHGMLISNGRFSGLGSNDKDVCSIELWLEPKLTFDSSTILSFYPPMNNSALQVRQSGDDLVVTNSFGRQAGPQAERRVYVERTFKAAQPVLITLTEEKETLNVYVNGILKKSTKKVRMNGSHFAGTMIVGNTPYGNLSWTGTFRGLAVYDRALRPEEITKDSAIWQGDRRLIAQKDDRPYSLYLFNEQSGTVLHNLGKAGPDLLIPKNYFIFEPGFLVPFWREYRASWEYIKDLAINVFGLVPLGVCFAALFAWLIGIKRSLLYTTVLGFCVSLTIELLQAFMPTRFSGTTDLITNTSGTALGAWLYLNRYSQGWLKRWGIVRAREMKS
jgi:hypothetical protein